MICYKDMTFCPGPCANTVCGRHSSVIEEARKEGNFLHQNQWMPIAWFVDIPIDCKEWIDPNANAA